MLIYNENKTKFVKHCIIPPNKKLEEHMVDAYYRKKQIRSWFDYLWSKYRSRSNLAMMFFPLYNCGCWNVQNIKKYWFLGLKCCFISHKQLFLDVIIIMISSIILILHYLNSFKCRSSVKKKVILLNITSWNCPIKGFNFLTF